MRILNKKVHSNQIGKKLKKSLVYSAIGILLSTTTAINAATLSSNCSVNVTSSTSLEVIGSDGAAIPISPSTIGVNATTGDMLSPTVLQCISLVPPSDITVPCAISATSIPLPGDGTPIYLARYDVPENTYCAYEVSLTPTAVAAIAFDPNMTPTNPINPTAVPIFTPIGILATMVGLLWFGRRRAVELKNN